MEEATITGSGTQRVSLPPDLARAVDSEVAAWRDAGKVERLLAHDPALWTGAGEERWLAWLDAPRAQLARLDDLRAFGDEVRAAGFRHALVLGMGGSSLCPDVLARTFGAREGWPELHVLDSTDPAQVASVESLIDPARTLFFVSSKSGTTLEPALFKDYFFDVAGRARGDNDAGESFLAITDPGSTLQAQAEADGFRRVFFGVPEIGGRYSALSAFGVVPAAAAGLDLRRLLEPAHAMARACAAPGARNPGLALGAVLGVLAREGRDKVTISASPPIEGVGAWLEQLLAESTGKDGRALIPVDRERLGPPDVYGNDRLFVHLGLDGAPDPAQEGAVAELERSGLPVVRLRLGDAWDLGREFFRWEFATAVAGSILSINPFDQPDVEASKVATRALTDEFERTGQLPGETPLLSDSGIALFTDAGNAARIGERAGDDRSLEGWLRAHLDSLGPDDYFAVLAYVEMSLAHDRELQALRHAVRSKRRVATCLGYGPRFLHSTGQAYKGGPNTGVFLQVTCEDARDLPVPGRKVTFGVVKAAQARGDFQVLAERGRRAVRAHLGPDVPAGLETLRQAVAAALS